MAGRVKKAAVNKKCPPIPIGEVLHDKVTNKTWRLGPPVGSGGFGVIYSACDHSSSGKKVADYPFVVKIEPHDNGSLFVEKVFYIRNGIKTQIAAYMKVKKFSTFGMPQYLGSGSHEYNGQKFRYLIMDRYGKDVWSLFKEAGVFRPATVFQIGLQMLDVVEYIHSKGYVHADIKGTNILLGLQKGTENQTYLIDFGLAARVNDKEFKPDKKCAHNGTIEYTSRDAHIGVPTMRGDLEILAYNMLHWLIGELPWEKSIKRAETVQKMKEDFMNNIKDIKKTYPNVPDAIGKLFEYVNSLKPKDKVDFKQVRPILVNYLKSLNIDTIKPSKLDFSKIQSSSTADTTTVRTERNVPKRRLQNGNQTRAKAVNRGEKRFKPGEENDENENAVSAYVSPPKLVPVVKLTKMSYAMLPIKKNYTTTATQTTFEIDERARRSQRGHPKKVSFASPKSILKEDVSQPNKSLSFSSKDENKLKYSVYAFPGEEEAESKNLVPNKYISKTRSKKRT